MKQYIAANQLPMDLQRRVIQWFDFAWTYKKDMSEEELFQQLNDNFRAEIAIHVNLDTLKKVKMFEHCDPSFLRELVLKLKPVLCSPGKMDYVREVVSSMISKHREDNWKYDTQRSIFDEIQSRCLEVWWNTVSSVWYIFSIETKTKE